VLGYGCYRDDDECTTPEQIGNLLARLHEIPPEWYDDIRD